MTSWKSTFLIFLVGLLTTKKSTRIKLSSLKLSKIQKSNKFKIKHSSNVKWFHFQSKISRLSENSSTKTQKRGNSTTILLSAWFKLSLFSTICVCINTISSLWPAFWKEWMSLLTLFTLSYILPNKTLITCPFCSGSMSLEKNGFTFLLKNWLQMVLSRVLKILRIFTSRIWSKGSQSFRIQ